MSWARTLFGLIKSAGSPIEVSGGVNFTGGLMAVNNPATGDVDVKLSSAGDPTDAAQFLAVIEATTDHTVDNDADYGDLPVARTVLDVRVSADAGTITITLPAVPEEGQTVRVSKATGGVHSVAVDPNGNLLQYRSRGTRSSSVLSLVANSATQRTAAWRWLDGAWVALDHGSQDGWLDASDITLSSNSVLANDSPGLGQGTAVVIGEGQILRRLAGEDLTAGKVTDALSELTPAGLAGTAFSVAVRASGTTGAMSALAMANGEVLGRSGMAIVSTKIGDFFCNFKSPDDKLTLDQVSASSQLTGTINTANSANLAGPTNIADGEFVRIVWTVLLTINSVDYPADVRITYKRLAGTLTAIAVKPIDDTPAGVTFTGTADGSNQPQLTIANATGFTITYYVHHSTLRQVK